MSAQIPYLEERNQRGKRSWRYRRRVPTKLHSALGIKQWAIPLGDDEHEAVIACRRLTAEHDDLVTRDPDEISEQRHENRRLREQALVAPLVDVMKNITWPDAVARYDGQSLWVETPRTLAESAKLPPKERMHRLQMWRALAFPRKPQDPAMHSIWQAQHDELLSVIEALDPKTVTLNEALERTIDFRQLSASTRRKYAEHIGELIKDLGGDPPVKHITKDQLRAHRDRLIADGKRPSTVDSHFTAIRSVLGFCVEEDIIESSPADRLRMPEDKRSIEEKKWLPFSPDEMTMILMRAEEVWGEPLAGVPRERREAYLLLVRVMSFTAMRPEEIVRLEPHEVTQEHITITRGKTSAAPRVIPLHPEISAFPEWISSGGMSTFTSQKTNEPMTVDGKTSVLRQNFRTLITKRIEPPIIHHRKSLYSLRSTFQNAMRRAGAPDKVRQAILGHREGTVLRHYDEGPEFELKRKWVEAADPRR